MYLLQNAYVAQMVMHMCIICNPIVHLCKSILFRCVNNCQEPDDLFETISQALLNAVDRDALSGWGAVVHIL